nr:hypothetical protein [Tanacetum cinerariifolium]
ANKKVALENPLCPNESKILAYILKNHPLRFSIATSSSVPWIYLGQFWHTLHEDGSKYTLKFMLDRKELAQVHARQKSAYSDPEKSIATNNNHDLFVPAPKFPEMVSFYVNNLGFTLDLRSTSNFKTTGLLQPWQTLCKMFPRCLTTRVTGYDQPSLQIMQMLYCFVSDIHVDYAELLWEGFHYSLTNPTTMIPYPRFTKLIVSHYMTAFLEISRQAHDRYHNLADDVMIKASSIHGRADDLILQDTLQVSLAEQKSREELEATQNVKKVKEHLIAEEIEELVKGSENVEENVEVHSSPLRNDYNQNNLSTRLEPKSDKESSKAEKIADISSLVNVIDKKEESAKDDYELSRRAKGKHLEEIKNTPSPTTIRSPRIQTNLVSLDTEKLQELTKSISQPSSSTPSSSSPKSKFSATNRLLSLFKAKPGHVMMKALPKLVDDRIKVLLKKQVPLYEAEGLILEREKIQADVAKMIVEARQQEHKNLCLEISSQVNDVIANHIPSHVDSSVRFYMTDDLQLQKDDVSIWLALKIKFERLQVAPTPCIPFAVRLRDQDDPHDDALHEKENSTKRHETSEHGMFEIGGSSSDQDYESEPGPSTSEIVARRANGSIVSITESDYKNLNKNDIEDMYLLIVNHKVDDYAETGLLWSLSVFIRSTMIWERVHDFQLGVESYQQQVNLTAPTITFPGIEKYEVFSIVSEPVYGIIYDNNNKEKRVMRHQDVHKFCDATLKRVLEGLKSYNNNVKYGYVTHNLNKDEVEYLQLFAE